MHRLMYCLGHQTITRCSWVGLISKLASTASLLSTSISLPVIQPSIPSTTGLHGMSSTNYHNDANLIDVTSDANVSTASFHYGLSNIKSSYTSIWWNEGCYGCTSTLIVALIANKENEKVEEGKLLHSLANEVYSSPCQKSVNAQLWKVWWWRQSIGPLYNFWDWVWIHFS